DLGLVVLQGSPLVVVVVRDLAPGVEQVFSAVTNTLTQSLGFSRLQSGVAARPIGEGLDHEVERIPLSKYLNRPLGRRHRGVAQAGQILTERNALDFVV